MTQSGETESVSRHMRTDKKRSNCQTVCKAEVECDSKRIVSEDTCNDSAEILGLDIFVAIIPPSVHVCILCYAVRLRIKLGLIDETKKSFGWKTEYL